MQSKRTNEVNCWGFRSQEESIRWADCQKDTFEKDQLINYNCYNLNKIVHKKKKKKINKDSYQRKEEEKTHKREENRDWRLIWVSDLKNQIRPSKSLSEIKMESLIKNENKHTDYIKK